MSAAPDPTKLQPYIAWTDTSGIFNVLQFDLVKSETWTDNAEITEHPVEKGANVADHVRVALDECELVIRSSNEPLDRNSYATATTFPPQPLNVPSPAWVPGPGLVVVAAWQNNIELRALAGALVGLGGGLGGPLGMAAGFGANALAGALLPGYEVKLPVSTSAGLTPPAPRAPVMVQVQQYPLGEDFVEKTHAKLKTLRDTAQILQVIGSKQVNFSMAIEELTFVRNADTGTGEMLTVRFKEIRVVTTQVVPAPIPNLSAGGGAPPTSHGAQNPQEAPAGPQLTLAEKWKQDWIAAGQPPIGSFFRSEMGF